MAERWIEITGAGAPRREPLREELTRVGGPGMEIVVEGAGDDQLQLWDDPTRVVFIGTGEAPTRGGVPFEEASLQPGDGFQWRGQAFVLGATTPASLEPVVPVDPVAAIAPAAPAAAPVPGGPTAGADDRAWARIRAGMLVDLKLADRRAVKRWQQTVLNGTFDPDACARDIHGAGGAPADDPRTLERSGRLLRDFLMMSYQEGLRGAGRRAREKTKGGIAYLMAQGFILLLFFLLFAMALIVARFKEVDVNGILDAILFWKEP